MLKLIIYFTLFFTSLTANAGLESVTFEVALPAQHSDVTFALIATCPTCPQQQQVVSDPQTSLADAGAETVQLKLNADGLNLVGQKKITSVFLIAQTQSFRDGAQVATSGPSLAIQAIATKIALYNKEKTGSLSFGNDTAEEMLRKGLLTGDEFTAFYKFLGTPAPPSSLVLVARVSGTVNQTVTTTIWAAKSHLTLDATQNKFSAKFPEDFSAPVSSTEEAKRPDYQLAIDNMRQAEKLGCEKIYPKQLFSESYLRSLPEDKVMTLIQQSGELVTKLKNRPATQATLTTILVDSLCEYKDLATILVKAAIAVIANIITGGTAFSLFKDLAENGVSLANEIKRLAN